jgi:hypothetical protein
LALASARIRSWTLHRAWGMPTHNSTAV